MLEPLLLEYLMGKREYECTPWGNRAYNIFGWQKPCCLIQDGCVGLFNELMNDMSWDNDRRASGNRACRQCMVHSGCEPSAVDHTFWTSGGLIATTRALLLNTCANPWTKPTLEEAKGLPCGPMAQASQMTVTGRPLVQAMSAA